VRALFDRIRQDPRHQDQVILHHSRGRRLLMTPWSMLLSPSFESAEHFAHRVQVLREKMQAGSQYAPTSVIRQLIMPMRLKDAREMPDPEAYHRVVVCAASGNGAFALVHWLAQQHNLPKESRRMAGESDLDSGSDYVEFMAGEHPCRVIAVARGAYTARHENRADRTLLRHPAAANPQPNTELEYTSVFELLAAVLLSAQATDVGVNKATRRLFPVANTPQDAGLGLRAGGHIKTIGLYRSKARHLLQTCRILVEQHGGEVPRTREALEALPGVGRKTANVVLNVAFGEPTMAVDTHIFRVSNRTGLAPGKTRWRWSSSCSSACPPPTRSTRTTG
jgi:endonuclease-3